MVLSPSQCCAKSTFNLQDPITDAHLNGSYLHQISKAPLLPTLAVPVLNDRSPNTTAVPALHVNMATLPELVAVPTPNEMVMESPKTVLQSKRLVASSNESDVNAVLIFVRCAIWFCNDFHSSLYLTSASEVCMWPLAGSTNMHENNGSVSQYFLSGVAISTGCCYLVQSCLPAVVKRERVDSSSTTLLWLHLPQQLLLRPSIPMPAPLPWLSLRRGALSCKPASHIPSSPSAQACCP